jgi:hypothetical protein
MSLDEGRLLHSLLPEYSSLLCNMTAGSQWPEALETSEVVLCTVSKKARVQTRLVALPLCKTGNFDFWNESL